MPRKGYRKPDAERRSVDLRIKTTAAERAAIEAAYGASEFAETGSLADFVRAALLGQRIKPRPSGARAKLILELAALHGELAKHGANLNQLARAANSGQTVEPSGLQAAIDDNARLRAELNAMLARVAPGR